MVKPLECSTLGSKGTPPPCRTMHGVRRSCARGATPTVSQHLLLGVRRWHVLWLRLRVFVDGKFYKYEKKRVKSQLRS